jgi:hypothetical protein
LPLTAPRSSLSSCIPRSSTTISRYAVSPRLNRQRISTVATTRLPLSRHDIIGLYVRRPAACLQLGDLDCPTVTTPRLDNLTRLGFVRLRLGDRTTLVLIGLLGDLNRLGTPSPHPDNLSRPGTVHLRVGALGSLAVIALLGELGRPGIALRLGRLNRLAALGLRFGDLGRPGIVCSQVGELGWRNIVCLRLGGPG